MRFAGKVCLGVAVLIGLLALPTISKAATNFEIKTDLAVYEQSVSVDVSQVFGGTNTGVATAWGWRFYAPQTGLLMQVTVNLTASNTNPLKAGQTCYLGLHNSALSVNYGFATSRTCVEGENTFVFSQLPLTAGTQYALLLGQSANADCTIEKCWTFQGSNTATSTDPFLVNATGWINGTGWVTVAHIPFFELQLGISPVIIEPFETDTMFDATALLLFFLPFGIFFLVAFYRNGAKYE